MPTLHVTGLGKSYGADTILAGVSFRLAPRERLALVGRNGSGKTTLLRILAGELGADAGEVGFPRTARVALHDQRPPRASGKTLAGYVGEGLADVRAVERRLADLEQRMANGDHGDDTLHDYAAAQADLEQAGGYAWRVRLESILRGLGFSDADADRELRTFSGGESTRASLARALASRPDLLLLDEPTNHLDLTSLDWLERELASLDTAILLVSHDRWFLESVATGVLELERGRARVFSMPYSAYRREKALQVAQAAEAFERQQEELARLERFVAKFKAGTRARQAQSVKKRIDRTARVERPRRERALAFGFPKTQAPSRVVLEAEGLRIEAGEKLLFDGASAVVERGQRIALIGPNGAGKTTLVETLIGRRRPAAGRIKVGHNVDLAYFTQHAEELSDAHTVLEAMCAGAPVNQSQARNILGRFLFSGDTVDRKVEVLSGGERRRLSLARVVASGANVLMLDEPTNHLDVESREALEDALDAFDGTIVLVSHDRALIDAVATHTLEVAEHRLVLRHGDYNDYLAAIAARAAPPPPKPARPVAAPNPAPAAVAAKRTAASGGSQRQRRRVAELEDRVAVLEATVAEIERELVDPAVMQDRDLLADAAERHRASQEQLSWVLREWEAAAEGAGA